MNTTNVLLATTSLLIVVAFALSFGGFNKDRESPESLAKFEELEKQFKELEAQNRLIELEHSRSIRPNYPPVVAAPAPTPTIPPLATSETELDAEERRLLQERIDQLQRDKDAAEAETAEMNKDRNAAKAKQMAAARRIDLASDMGRVVSANKKSGFVIYDPSLNAPNHQPGQILSIRRNSGILGKIQVERLDESGQYIAVMLPQVFAADGYPDILPGDTVIIDPDS